MEVSTDISVGINGTFSFSNFFLSCKTGCKNIVYAINTVKCNNRAVKQCRQLW